HARYDAKTHGASIAGQLVAGGKPRFGVAVYVHQIGVDDPDTPADITDENGRFSVGRPVTKTTSFRVYVDDRTSSCFDPSTAPAFTSVKSAHTAFDKEAQLADMKCEARDYASGLDPDARVAKLTRVTLPAAGNEVRAYRSLVTSSLDNVALDLVFVRVGRVV